MMDIDTVRTLRDEEEYLSALKAVRPYFDNELDADTLEAGHFDALTLLIEEYEARHYPIPQATPVDRGKDIARGVLSADTIESA